MNEKTENNKRIAKNTLFLYFRMFVTLLVGLYTSRVVLQALGVSDYGLYSVVGGLIGLLTYINNLLSQGTSRFVTIALGEGNKLKLQKVFSASITMHIVIAIITFILGETIGLWFVKNHMNIDVLRLDVVNWVYHLALLSCVFTILQVPYNACIIAYEKMSIFAYFSIFDVLLKLLGAFLLLYVDTDKLILYSTFNLGVSFVNLLLYFFYCFFKFRDCKTSLSYDKQLYIEIGKYVGWNSLGTFAFTVNNQGLNILLNVFFGTLVNAARGIATTVGNIINQFVSGFQTAIRPQIIKYYAQNNIEEMNKLIFNDSKYSSFLVLLIGLPLFWEAEYLINLWLGQTPKYVVQFVQMTIIQMYIQALDAPIGTGIHAYGRLKLPNLTSSIIYLSILPISYLIMKLGGTPIVIYWVTITAYPLAMGFDLWILNKYSDFNVRIFLLEICLKSIYIIGITSMFLVFVVIIVPSSFIRLILSCIISFFVTSILIYYVGLNSEMRQHIIHKFNNKIVRTKLSWMFLS